MTSSHSVYAWFNRDRYSSVSPDENLTTFHQIIGGNNSTPTWELQKGRKMKGEDTDKVLKLEDAEMEWCEIGGLRIYLQELQVQGDDQC